MNEYTDIYCYSCWSEHCETTTVSEDSRAFTSIGFVFGGQGMHAAHLSMPLNFQYQHMQTQRNHPEQYMFIYLFSCRLSGCHMYYMHTQVAPNFNKKPTRFGDLAAWIQTAHLPKKDLCANEVLVWLPPDFFPSFSFGAS